MTASRLPTDPADLFAVLYDDLAADQEQFNRQADHWVVLPGFQETASEVEHMAHSEGEIDQARLHSWLLPDSAPHRLAMLIGIDRALAHVNPRQDSVDAGALGSLLRRYAKKGRLSTENVRGAVLPRLTWPAEPAHQSTMAEAFIAVIRVSDASWQAIRHDRVKGSQDLSKPNRQVSVTVAPLLESLEDIDITRIPGCSRDPRTGKPVDGYVLRPVDREEIRTRIRGILSRLTKEKAVIGVLPEASLCNSLLDYWRELLRQLNQDPDADPRHCWILVGTGPIGEPGLAGRYSNRAVILDQSGEQVFSQDKTRDFSLTPKIIKDWGLAEKLGGATLAVEWINRGSKIEIRESFAGRFAILICEDITDPGIRNVLKDCGVSHLLVPIFASPLKGNWEFPRSDAQQYVRKIGSWVLAVNSLVTAGDNKAASFIGMLTGPSAASHEEWGDCHLKFIDHDGPHGVGVVTLPPDPGLPQVS